MRTNSPLKSGLNLSLPHFVFHDHGACSMCMDGRFCLHKRIPKQKNSGREHCCVWTVAQALFVNAAAPPEKTCNTCPLSYISRNKSLSNTCFGFTSGFQVRVRFLGNILSIV